ncbi:MULTISPECIES: hypothetical protein [Citrobacter]|uniref:hypothetical protein n=1 Tax=Citrobacter TaxID=544 RepID=UPI001377F211|nr:MULTISPECIES: hypothetical protein [Citrobacter]NBD81747.1 hypothetical protein [Citrobacter werkmanii]UQX57274.1 hypothetical protein M4I31_12395 [Citrobacter sp. XT1-2-2]
MNNNARSLEIARQVLIRRARAAGGEPAVQAMLDRLTANYSLIQNNGSDKKH